MTERVEKTAASLKALAVKLVTEGDHEGATLALQSAIDLNFMDSCLAELKADCDRHQHWLRGFSRPGNREADNEKAASIGAAATYARRNDLTEAEDRIRQVWEDFAAGGLHGKELGGLISGLADDCFEVAVYELFSGHVPALADFTRPDDAYDRIDKAVREFINEECIRRMPMVGFHSPGQEFENG